MFYCTAGHTSLAGERRILVPTKIREVETTHTYLSKESRRKIAIMGNGTEIVHEEPYCQLHAPNVKAEVVDHVRKTHTSFVKLERDDRDDDDDD